MIGYQDLLRARPDRQLAAAAEWRRLAADCVAHHQEFAAVVAGMGRLWHGPAATAASRRITVTRDDLAAQFERLPAGAAVMEGHARRVAELQQRLRAVVAAVAHAPIVVDSAGRVALAPCTGTPEQLRHWAALRDQTADRIVALLAEATALDQATTAKLASLGPAGATATQLATAGAVVTEQDIRMLPADPRAVNQWWNALSVFEQQYILRQHPEWIGMRDGIPCVARDQANRVLLDRETNRLTSRRDQLRAQLAGTPIGRQTLDTVNAMRAELADLDAKLTSLGQIRDRLGDTGPGRPRAYLLGLDTHGNGRAIVAVGNPDQAAHVATYVPGTFSGLGDLKTDLRRTELMQQEATARSDGAVTSVIMWVGYDAPQSLPLAGREHYADQAKEDLDRFQDGLRVTHEGPRSHNTVLGHSYGSTVVGFAARDHRLDVDEIMFAGSPGVGVDHARDLHLPPGHVWSTTAQNDVIRQTRWASVEWSTPSNPEPLPHGANPSRPEFGNQPFHSDPGVPFYRDLEQAHTAYWQEGSTSLKSMGGIIAGKGPIRECEAP